MIKMTHLGTLMQAGLSVALTLAPATVLKKDRMRITLALCFLAILTASHVGGLVIAISAAGFLLLFSLWVRFVGQAASGPKRVLFMVTIAVSAFFFAQHVVHLPIRFALNQPALKIASNVSGISLSAAMLCATLELLILGKRKNLQLPGPGSN